LIIEDVITTGASALQAVATVEEAGGQILGVLAVVDRQQGGRQALEAEGLQVVSLTTSTALGLI
jgi:orotate phosphoribosyltransferase